MIAQENKITNDNVLFIDYPEFPDQHSTWGDIGYSAVHNKVYIGVTNHHDNIALYEYDVAKDDMNKKGFISEMANLREWIFYVLGSRKR
jgi:hypothetical protein